MPSIEIIANGLSFRVVTEGRGDGDRPPVLLLHGFPDSAALWRHQIPALTAAGHRVIAPDLRGFGSTDRPEGIPQYAMSQLLADVLGILDALDVREAAVVAHDWGASLGWALAAFAPERVTRYAALSVGHPSGYLATMRQRELSWYMLFFLFEGVAEQALPRDDWALLRDWLGEPVDLDRYIEDLSRPGALTAALNVRAGFSIAVPVGPLAQVWRGGPRQANLARFLSSTASMAIIEWDTAGAMAAGVLCGRTGTADVVDASVALVARERNHAVLTRIPGIWRLSTRICRSSSSDQLRPGDGAGHPDPRVRPANAVHHRRSGRYVASDDDRRNWDISCMGARDVPLLTIMSLGFSGGRSWSTHQ